MAVYLEKQDIGATLTTWIYCAMWQLWAAEKMGKQGYIHWPNDPARCLQPYFDAEQFIKQPNMYDWYFKQPYAEPMVGWVPERDTTWTWETSPETGQHQFMAEPLVKIKHFYRDRLFFNDVVEARGRALVEKYGLDFSNTIGVTWRGTDCVTDGRPRLPIEVYFPFIDDILAKAPQARLMCTAEETEVLSPLLARYPQAFTVDEFYASPNGDRRNPERFSPFSGFERGMQPALMVWLFSKCRYYVKNRSSTGAVASWLAPNQYTVCLAHPENLGYSFDLSKAEIEGKLVELYR